MESKLRRAFVIDPIGDKDEPAGSPARLIYEEAIQVFEDVIVPACEAFGLEAVRADRISRTGEILEQVCRYLRDAEIVIADLTGANPNVLYELGLRHTTGKLTIQIGERGRLPFDISAIRTQMFKRTESGLIDARRKLIGAIEHALESGGDQVTATRVWLESKSVLAGLSSPIEVEEEDKLGFLEELAESEEGMTSLSVILESASETTSEITDIFENGMERVNQLAPSAGSTAKLAIANQIGAALGAPAEKLQRTAQEMQSTVAKIEPGLRFLIERVAEEPGQLEEAPDFVPQMESLIAAAEQSIASTLEFKTSMSTMGNATRSLRRPGQKIAAALQLIADTAGRIVGWRKVLEPLKAPEAT